MSSKVRKSLDLKVVSAYVPDNHKLTDFNGTSIDVTTKAIEGFYNFQGDTWVSTHSIKIDTGACISVIPREHWDTKDRRDQIRWIHDGGGKSADELPESPRSFSTVGRTGIAAYFGRVNIQIFDRNYKNSIDQELVAAFASEYGLRGALLGIGGGSLDDGGIRIELNSDNAEIFVY